jgi:hypothetical protein
MNVEPADASEPALGRHHVRRDGHAGGILTNVALPDPLQQACPASRALAAACDRAPLPGSLGRAVRRTTCHSGTFG